MADPLGGSLDPSQIVQNLSQPKRTDYDAAAAAQPPPVQSHKHHSSLFGDIGGAIEGAAKDVGGAVTGLPTAIGSILHDVGHFIAGQQVPGSQVPGMGGPTTFGQAVDRVTGGGKKKSSDPPAATPAQPTGQAQPTAQAPDDVLTAGLGMYFSQYLAPMMQQINSQNNSMINQWGNTMNQLLQQPLPAGVKAIMQPWVAQNAQTLGMINTAAADQVAGQIPFNTLMNQLGQESSAQQALATALPTAAANQMLGGSGGAQGVGQMLANQGLANTPIGSSILSLLSQPSFLQSLTNTGKSGSGTSSSSTGTQQAVTPIQVLPSTTPTTTSSTASNTPNDLMNTIYAQQLAQAMLTANQPSAQQANAQAASGYTP